MFTITKFYKDAITFIHPSNCYSYDNVYRVTSYKTKPVFFIDFIYRWLDMSLFIIKQIKAYIL
jgi:hypothetical protein